MLANLRRAALSPGTGGSSGGSSSRINDYMAPDAAAALSPVPTITPTVPPEIAHILLSSPSNSRNIGVGGRRPAAVGAHGGGVGAQGMADANARGVRRRGPAGPAPPPSWLAQSRHSSRPSAGSHDYSRQKILLDRGSYSDHAGEDMPGVAHPARGSLVDLVLRRIVQEWDVQKHYNQHYFIYIQGFLRAALITYLGQQSKDVTDKGVSIKDLRTLLLHPLLPSTEADSDPPLNQADEIADAGKETELSGTDDDPGGGNLTVSSSPNEDFSYLDLTWSVGRSVSIRELSDLLFPQAAARLDVVDSWDAPGRQVSLPRPLLPNLTHLSLALVPEQSPSSVSWRQLLSFASHLPMLTHLSLAYWPEPTLTPNAKLATVDSPLGRRFQYSGTGAYSHSLDNDWAEAVLLVRKLSKALYGLEYLDLTGCVSWLPALMHNVDNGQVDWVGNWGKIKTLVVNYGVANEYDRLAEEDLRAAQAEDQPELLPGWSAALHLGEVARRVNAASEARLVEDHIRQQRAGRGRFITVVYDRQLQTSRAG
ncbi:hypothetical protein SEPCBS119000_001003 [Sporothrix epigloea]|uniref:Tafazzin n=1 Tax=Sporothrix epigloea TaxID=1892477 RepID=A0ABP0D8C7_9PEZI